MAVLTGGLWETNSKEVIYLQGLGELNLLIKMARVTITHFSLDIWMSSLHNWLYHIFSGYTTWAVWRASVFWSKQCESWKHTWAVVCYWFPNWNKWIAYTSTWCAGQRKKIWKCGERDWGREAYANRFLTLAQAEWVSGMKTERKHKKL